MKKFFYATMCIVSLCLSGCGYDDDEVWNAINDQEERIAALEEWQKTANENIAALQAIVNGNDYITSVEEIKDGDEIIGYTINFHRQGEVTIYNGKDGEKGDMPVIGVSEGEDGRWYWTVNGELLEDADGNPVCANGKDGEDGEDGEDGADGNSSSGVTPVIKLGSELGEGYNQYASYISVDGGRTWTQITTTYGMTGYVLDVIYNISDEYYEFDFTDQDGKTLFIQIPKYTGLELTCIQKEDGVSHYMGIHDGVLSVETGKAFTIECYLLADGNLDCTLEENTDEWKMTQEKDSWGVSLKFDAIENPGTATLKLTLISSNNEVTYYQVKITANGGGKEEVIIEKTENAELAEALAGIGVGTTNEEGDIVLTQEDITNTTSLDLSNRNLNNLEGLEVFTNLTKLDCSNNQISELDLTKAPNLTSLNCSDNSLASLDVSVLPELIELRCDRCFSSSNSRSYSNGVLDLSACTKLQVLSCTNNGLTELILPETLILVDIYCSNNNLKRLDVSRYTRLSQIHCEFNQLIELKLPKTQTLKEVWCKENELTSLDVSGNIALERLTCNSNDLERLNVRTNTSLQVLECQENQLKALDISQNGMLTVLYVGFNSLSDIDVSMNKALEELSCEYNQLTKLDISPCKDLKELACSSNQLLTLDISQNTKLTYITCGYQHNIDEVEQMLSLVVNEAQKESWENDWVYYNEYVKIVSGAVNVSGGIGNNFEYGGVY